MKPNLHIGIVVTLLLAMVVVVDAQPAPLPLPDALGRGARTTPVPFYVPAQLASSTRGTTYVVTTFADSSVGGCSELGGGLSLREALEECQPVDGYMIVYLPAGLYTLDSAIEPAFSGLALIGENPATTTIQAADLGFVGVDNMLRITANDQAVTIMNVTFRNGSSSTNDGSDGGAIAVNGSGTLTLHNVVFEDNAGFNGGALAIESQSSPIVASISNTSFFGNSADESGGAIYFLGLDSNGNHLSIRNSVFDANRACDPTCPGNEFGGAIYAFFASDEGDALAIDNSEFTGNTFGVSTVGSSYGGAIAAYHQVGFLSLEIAGSDFIGNDAPNDGYGGALYIEASNGVHNIAHSYFEGNQARIGGAVYDYASYSFTADTVQFSANIAEASGGAMYLESGRNVSVVASVISENRAGEYGGGIYLLAEPAYFGDSIIVNNLAGSDDLGSGGAGGGLYLSSYGVGLARTLVEDNIADTGPDCRTGSEPVRSLGGVGITSLLDCEFLPNYPEPVPPTDQVGNLLINGGFEQPYDDSSRAIVENRPAAWTLKKVSGDKRRCNTATKLFTRYGKCAFVFAGGGASASLSQNVDLLTNAFADNDELLLFALGDGASGSKVVVQAIATYADTQLSKTKVKLTFSGGSPDYQPAPGSPSSLVLTSGTLSKLQVKITDKSAGGKFSLDRVYLFRAATVTVPNRGPLPPPSAPAGFRGSS